MPAWILDKGGVDPQIHTHRFAAAGTAGNQPRGDPKIGLRPNHFMHKRLIVIGFLVTRHAALPQSIIALHVEQAVMIESRPLELMIDIGRDHKIILPLHEFQQPFIHRIAGRAVSVQLNIPAPIGPVFLQRIKWVKSAGIHILKSIRIREILEMFIKSRTRHREAGADGEAGPRADHDGLRLLQCFPQSRNGPFLGLVLFLLHCQFLPFGLIE